MQNTFTSTLNENNTLNNTGTILDLKLSGKYINCYYHIFCGDGAKYLWGTKNIPIRSEKTDVNFPEITG